MGMSEISIGRNMEVDNYTIPNKREVKDINTKTKAEEEFDGKKEYTEEDVKSAVKYINRFFGDSHAILKYERHKNTSTMILKLVDEETQEVLKEIPPEKIIDMVDKICELVGMVVDKKA